jgi:hypothetical protein
MRKLINLINENLRPMVPSDYRGGSTINSSGGEQHIQGAPRENMSYVEAKEYLDSNPDGVLCNDVFEKTNFVTKDVNGAYIFWDDIHDRVLTWDWDQDIKELLEDGDYEDAILHGWWYHPGEEMHMTNGGRDWWDKLRSGDMTPPPAAAPKALPPA